MTRAFRSSSFVLLALLGGCSGLALDPPSNAEDPIPGAQADGDGGTTLSDGGTSFDGGSRRDAGFAWPFDYSWTPTPGNMTWLGMNVSGDLPYIDLAQQLAQFSTDGGVDAEGYPLAGVSAQSWSDFGFILPTGSHSYKISYKGTGTLNVTGIGALSGPWTTVGDEHRNVVVASGTPGAFGQGLALNIVNGPGQTVHDIHLYMEGYDYGSRQYFTNELLDALAPFRTLRFMGWQIAWTDDVSQWSDRAPFPHFGQSPRGVPLEVIAGLINETGKDLWISIPYDATDDYVVKMADFFRDGLDYEHIDQMRAAQGLTGPFRIHLEYCNEVWTGNMAAANKMLAKANANPSRYSGQYAGARLPAWMAQDTNLMKVGQAHADTLAQMGKVWRDEFAVIGKSDLILPVLGGWALGAAYSDVGLLFVQQHYSGPVSNWISEVAIAPYFGTDDANTGDLPTLFTALNQNIAAMGPTFADFKAMGDGYGIPIVAYEGGQGLVGTTNQNIKHLAQFDDRMYAAHNAYFALWKQHFGKNLFNYYALSGAPGTPEFVYQWGYWSVLDGLRQDKTTCVNNLPTLTGSESISSQLMQHCPKWKALREQTP